MNAEDCNLSNGHAQGLWLKWFRAAISTRRKFCILVFALISAGPSCLSWAETTKAFYAEYEVHSYHSGHRNVPRYRFWRAEDGTMRLEHPIATRRDGASRTVTIATSDYIAYTNTLNGKTVLVSRESTNRILLSRLESEFSCFDLCATGQELAYFREHGEGKFPNGNFVGNFRLSHNGEEYVLRGQRYPIPGVREVEAVNSRSAALSVQRKYLAYFPDVPVEKSIFELPKDNNLIEAKNDLSFDALWRLISAPIRPEHFLEEGRILESRDFNFDGIQDFSVYEIPNGKCPFWTYYIHDQENEKFTHEPVFDRLCHPWFDMETRAIYTSHVGGCSGDCFVSDRYIWKDGVPVIISRIRQDWREDVQGLFRESYLIHNGEEQLILEEQVKESTELWDFRALHLKLDALR